MVDEGSGAEIFRTQTNKKSLRLCKAAYQTSGWQGMLLEQVRGFEEQNRYKTGLPGRGFVR